MFTRNTGSRAVFSFISVCVFFSAREPGFLVVVCAGLDDFLSFSFLQFDDVVDVDVVIKLQERKGKMSSRSRHQESNSC